MGLVMDHQQKQSPKPCLINCPRCNSTNTKFCYYNNYSLSQPRHFCKGCKRYWTRGGTLRNVPVGGGFRKNNNRVIRRAQSSPVPNPTSSLSNLVKPPAVSSSSNQQVPQMGITLISASAADGPKKDALLTPLHYGLLGMSSGGYGDLIQPQQCSYSDMNVNSNNDPFRTGYNNHIVGYRSLYNEPVYLQDDKDLGTGPGTAAGQEASTNNQNDHLPQILFPLQAMLQQQSSSTAIARGHDPLAQRWNDNQLQNDPDQNVPVYWISTCDSNVASWPPDHLPNTDG